MCVAALVLTALLSSVCATSTQDARVRSGGNVLSLRHQPWLPTTDPWRDSVRTQTRQPTQVNGRPLLRVSSVVTALPTTSASNPISPDFRLNSRRPPVQLQRQFHPEQQLRLEHRRHSVGHSHHPHAIPSSSSQSNFSGSHAFRLRSAVDSFSHPNSSSIRTRTMPLVEPFSSSTGGEMPTIRRCDASHRSVVGNAWNNDPAAGDRISCHILPRDATGKETEPHPDDFVVELSNVPEELKYPKIQSIWTWSFRVANVTNLLNFDVPMYPLDVSLGQIEINVYLTFPPGGRRKQIRKSPMTVKFDPADFDCSVCLERMTSEPFVILSRCGHRFHRQCFAGCVNHSEGAVKKCPLCRTNIARNVVSFDNPRISYDYRHTRVYNQTTVLRGFVANHFRLCQQLD